MDNKQIGRCGISAAILYFTRLNYTISLPINDTQWYDLVIEKDGIFKTVQCKATNTKIISLRSCGGNNGKTHYYIYDNPVDILFCLKNNSEIYEIPVKDIIKSSNKTYITLNSTKAKNGVGFNSYQYYKGTI